MSHKDVKTEGKIKFSTFSIKGIRERLSNGCFYWQIKQRKKIFSLEFFKDVSWVGISFDCE
jgi:hypothetical protein